MRLCQLVGPVMVAGLLAACNTTGDDTSGMVSSGPAATDTQDTAAKNSKKETVMMYGNTSHLL